jgi:2-polyprenyl-6-methoxyphenol hydroxylase-like FAD-dependent oxidoreductase
MVSNSLDTEVLIVGAGPVGLFLANECARRHMRWRLIEERPSQSEHSKALAIFPRTLEIFDMAGIVAPFLEKANRVTKVTVMIRDRRLAHLTFEPDESPYAFVAMVPQDVTERLLAEELRRKGGEVEYEAKFILAEQDDQNVSVTIDNKGKSTQVRAGVVVGCDGAHSAVRHQLNLPFEGAEYRRSFMLADVETNDTLSADEMQLCPSEFGRVAIFPMSPTRRRVVATVENAEVTSRRSSLYGRYWRNAHRVRSRHALCTGAATFVFITAKSRDCVRVAYSSRAMQPTFTAHSAARE